MNTTPLIRPVCFCISSTFLSLLSPVMAEDPAPTEGQLPESTITALRYEQDLTKVPYSVSSLDDEKLTAPQFYNLPDALGSLPGVMNQKTAQGQGSPYIRGFTSFRNLMLIDGIRFNNSVFREGPNQYWSTIDPYSLGGVELVRGPGSTLYGSDAIGGTVNALTRGTYYREMDPEKFFWGGTVDLRYDSSGDSGIYRVEGLMGVGDQWGLRIGYTLKNFGDIRAADVGVMEKTGYDEQDFDLRFDYAFNSSTRMTFVHQQVSQDDVWRSHKTIYGFDWEGANHGSELRRSFDQDRSLTYLRFEGEDTESFVDKWQLTASFQTMDEERYRVRNKSGVIKTDTQGFNVDTYGLALQLESETSFGRLVYGMDYYQDQVDSYSSSNPVQGPVGDDGRYETFGAFIQDVWEISDKWDITLGGRYAYVKADIGKVDDKASGQVISINDSWDTATFSLRSLYQANDCWSLFGGISQGFRAPNLSDLSRLDSARSNEYEIPSAGLDPEYFTTFEIGGHYKTETAQLNMSVFYTDVRDMIMRTPTGVVDPSEGEEISKQNAGDGYVWGMEVSGDWEFVPQWTVFSQVAWTDSSVSTYPTSAPVLEDEPLSRQMPLMGNLGIRWTQAEGKYWIEGIVNAAAKADQLSTRDKGDTNRIPPGGTPSYVVPSLRGGWNATDHLTLTVALENLTDEAYRIHGSGVNEPGFHAVVGARMTW